MSKNEKKTSHGFLHGLMETLFGKADPEAERKRLLKNIAKEINSSKFKYYKPSSGEIQPAFSKFFFELYKVLHQTQMLFNSIKNPNALKNITFDFCLDDKQRQLVDSLSEEAIAAMASKEGIKETSEKVKRNIEAVFSSFDTAKIRSIDGVYNRVLAIKSVACYDFYFLLKKANSAIREGDFSVSPHFGTVSGEYMAEDLKEFISVAWTLPLDDDWNAVCELLKSVRQIDVLPAGTWRKAVARLRAIRTSGILENMVRYMTKDPFFDVGGKESNIAIVDEYLNKLRSTAGQTLERLRQEQKDSKSGNLMQDIFGSPEVVRLRNYVAEGSEPLERKGLDSYKYWQPLNCLKAFLIDFVKKDVREYADLVLVRGTWTTSQLSAPMSDAFHDLIDASDKITEFDERLAENGDLGMKLKTLLPRADREKEAHNIITTTINDINGYAREFIVESYKNLVTFAKSTKQLIEDHGKTSGQMIINWSEVDRFAEGDIQEMGVAVYKKIYTFAQLMQNFLSE